MYIRSMSVDVSVTNFSACKIPIDLYKQSAEFLNDISIRQKGKKCDNIKLIDYCDIFFSFVHRQFTGRKKKNINERVFFGKQKISFSPSVAASAQSDIGNINDSVK